MTKYDFSPYFDEIYQMAKKKSSVKFGQFLLIFMGIRLTEKKSKKINFAFYWILLRQSLDLVEI